MKAERRTALVITISIVVIAHIAGAYILLRGPSSSVLPRVPQAVLGRDSGKLLQHIEREPCNRRIQRDIASKLLVANEYLAVIEMHKIISERCGDANNLLPFVFSAQMGLSKFTSAEQTASALVAEHPADPSAYGWRAQAREKRGDATNAYKDMLKALSLFPDPANVSGQVYYDTAKLAAKAGFPCEASNILRDYVVFDVRKRKTQQVDSLIKEWQTQGSCSKPFGEGGASIRYDTKAPSIIVPIEINGILTNMIFDTGATMTLVTQDLARRAGIHVLNYEGTAQTADGNIKIMYGKANTMSLGGATLHNAPIAIHGSSIYSFGDTTEGLLGLSFLGNFQVTVNNGSIVLKPLE